MKTFLLASPMNGERSRVRRWHYVSSREVTCYLLRGWPEVQPHGPKLLGISNRTESA
jgi:hypothetical protein